MQNRAIITRLRIVSGTEQDIVFYSGHNWNDHVENAALYTELNAALVARRLNRQYPGIDCQVQSADRAMVFAKG